MTKKYFKTCIMVLPFLLIVALVVGCGSRDTGPVTQAEIKAQKEVINNYYEAINKKDYEKAYDMTTKNFQQGLSFSNFEYQCSAYINSVKVSSISMLENFSDESAGVYDVSFDASYRQKYPSGDGNLPGVHVIQKDAGNWKIDSIGIKNFE